MVYGSGGGQSGGSIRSFGGSTLGTAMFVLGAVGTVVYNALVVFAGANESAAATWFPVGIAGLGAALILWGRMTEAFEEHHAEY